MHTGDRTVNIAAIGWSAGGSEPRQPKGVHMQGIRQHHYLFLVMPWRTFLASHPRGKSTQSSFGG